MIQACAQNQDAMDFFLLGDSKRKECDPKFFLQGNKAYASFSRVTFAENHFSQTGV